jgi:starch phosphorylase
MAFLANWESFILRSEALRSALEKLAGNYRWTWSASTRRLFEQLPGHDGQAHPATLVSALDDAAVDALADDGDFTARIQAELDELESLLTGQETPTIAYCSPEFGLSGLLPQYAGGLGVLAGDHLKSASDLGLALSGVGLFYREGVFRQVIEDGQQSEVYRPVDPRSVGATDTDIVVEVPFPGRVVAARVWRIDVGRVPLLLLDTDLEANTDHDRRITDRLYAGDRAHRLEQEMVLGVGGAKALADMGWNIELHHLNEGHAGFIVLELIDRIIGKTGFERAVELVRASLAFTTHTPVPAGIDRFAADTIEPYLSLWAERWGVSVERLWELGRDPEDEGRFNMAALCLRTTRMANGVSRLHGQVSRKLFAGVGIGDDISHVTNGVHARTWTADHAQLLFDEVLGRGWASGDPTAWERATEIPSAALRAMRRRSSEVLSELAAERVGARIDPDALIVGFARRFAPYKRATLLLRRPETLAELIGDDDLPVHFVFSGKAHPSDAKGKALVADVVRATNSESTGAHFSFIPDYDMEVAHALVQGCDIWLNNPIRPREASGTSGEKAALNGGLNCSVLDGWWAEMYDGHNGWVIEAADDELPEARDQTEAESALRTLISIRDEYHDRSSSFDDRIVHAWTTLGPRITAARMVREYEETIYRPLLEARAN